MQGGTTTSSTISNNGNVLAKLYQWCQSRYHRMMYFWIGPAKIHLQHEFYLFISLVMLTASSLPNNTRDDLYLLLLIAIWLGSRHLLVRWICTWDVSTNRRPTLTGIINHWLNLYIVGGQYFDRPQNQHDQQQEHQQLQQATTTISNPNVVLSSGSILTNPLLQLSTSCAYHGSPLIQYTWQFIKIRIIFPIYHVQNLIASVIDPNYNQRAIMMVRNASLSTSPPPRQSLLLSPSQIQELTKQWNNLQTSFKKIWYTYAPTLQMLIPLIVFCFYVTNLFFTQDAAEISHALTMNTHKHPNNNNDGQQQQQQQAQHQELLDAKPFGAYQKLQQPTWSQVLFVISCGGTLASILFYGRIILPLYDLAASTGGIYKTLRARAKQQSVSSGGGLGSNVVGGGVSGVAGVAPLAGTGVVGGGGSNSKSPKYKSTKDSHNSNANNTDEIPWTEQYRSITTENKCQFVFQIMILRILEHLFLVLLLPQSGFACRATQNCPEGTPLWELSKILYPIGITTTSRTNEKYYDYQYMSDNIIINNNNINNNINNFMDHWKSNNKRTLLFFGSLWNQFQQHVPNASTIMTGISIILITICLLLSQAATVNRSYFSTTAILTLEWSSTTESNLNNSFTQQGQQLRRSVRSSNNNNNSNNNKSSFNNTTTSSSSSSSYFDQLNIWFQLTRWLFLNEMGHVQTSRIIYRSCQALLMNSFCIVSMIGYHQWNLYPIGSLLWILGANLIAMYGISTIGNVNYSEMGQLAFELQK